MVAPCWCCGGKDACLLGPLMGTHALSPHHPICLIDGACTIIVRLGSAQRCVLGTLWVGRWVVG